MSKVLLVLLVVLLAISFVRMLFATGTTSPAPTLRWLVSTFAEESNAFYYNDLYHHFQMFRHRINALKSLVSPVNGYAEYVQDSSGHWRWVSFFNSDNSYFYTVNCYTNDMLLEKYGSQEVINRVIEDNPNDVIYNVDGSIYGVVQYRYMRYPSWDRGGKNVLDVLRVLGDYLYVAGQLFFVFGTFLINFAFDSLLIIGHLFSIVLRLFFAPITA